MMKKINSLEEHQKVLMKILSDFDIFCSENGVEYSLAYGTMIGALRHNGFIPWDDDLDVLMTRSQYEKFEKAFAECGDDEKYDLWGIYGRRNYFTGYIAKFYSRKTRLVEHLKREVKYGAYIDIFIIDRLPAKRWKAKPFLYLYRYTRRLMQICSRHADVIDPLHKYIRVIPSYENVCRFMKWFLSLPSDKSEVYGITTKAYDRFEKNILDVNEISGYKRVKFGDREYPVFNGSHSILTKIYGDYMTLPREEEQVPHHAVDLCVMEDFYS